MKKLDWHGPLSLRNTEEVAATLRHLLCGKRFTIVCSTEQGGWVPQVLTGRSLDSAVKGNGIQTITYGGISIVEDTRVYYVNATIDKEEEDKWSRHDTAWFRFEYNKVTIFHKAGGGDRLIWVFAVEKTL